MVLAALLFKFRVIRVSSLSSAIKCRSIRGRKRPSIRKTYRKIGICNKQRAKGNSLTVSDVTFGSSLCENAREQRMRRIVFSLLFLFNVIETKVLRAFHTGWVKPEKLNASKRFPLFT